VFTGNVLVTKGTIIIRGARMDVRQDAEGYQYGVVTAAPGKRAYYKQKRNAPDEWIEGESEVIEYDSRADNVKFIGRAVMRRLPVTEERTGDPIDVIAVDDVVVDTESHEVTLRGELVTLPLKEFELLTLLMENAGRVLPRSTLIDRVWGSDYVGDTKTLDVHVKRLRAKIEDDPSAPERIITIRGLGYKYASARVGV